LIAIIIRIGKKGVTAVDLARSLFADGKTLRDISSMSSRKSKRQGSEKAGQSPWQLLLKLQNDISV